MGEVIKTDDDIRLSLLVKSLQARLGRDPTEDEVLSFIFGSEEERIAIWNKEASCH